MPLPFNMYGSGLADEVATSLNKRTIPWVKTRAGRQCRKIYDWIKG